MSSLKTFAPLEHEQFRVAPRGAGAVELSGTLTLRDPGSVVGPYLDEVHRAVVSDGLDEVVVDVSALSFMNSSAIRLFIDWLEWAKGASSPYKLCFITNRSVTWQRTTFSAVKALGGERVSVVDAT